MNFLKKLLVAVLVLGFIAGIYAIYFLVSNNAPITQGEIQYAVKYKEGLSLDIYSPIEEVYEEHPVIIFFHGGGWFAGRKESINFNRYNRAVSELREKGYYLIAPEYTLATKEHSPFPNCIQDAFEVVKWVKANQASYGFDLNNVGVFGESAGGHIALMTTYSDPTDFSSKRPISLQYVVDIYGPTDLEKLFHSQMIDSLTTLLNKLPNRLGDHLDISHRIFGFDPDEDSSKTTNFLAKYSPVSYLREGLPPTLMIHGNADVVVPIQQSLDLHAELNERGIINEFHSLPNVNHAFIGASQAQKDSIQSWVTAFVLSKYNVN